jgi:CheY-like chemotaxis protein
LRFVILELFLIVSDGDLILLAEDNENDILLLRRAFEKGKLANPIHVVRDGEEAIAYLSGDGKYSDREKYPLPALLLLDIKLPRKDGFEVLEWVRQQPGLQLLRVVVLTSSERTSDVNRAYQLGANSFLIKPVDFGDFIRLVQAISGYWLWMSRAPEVLDSRSGPSLGGTAKPGPNLPAEQALQ